MNNIQKLTNKKNKFDEGYQLHIILLLWKLYGAE
jgi:hypothetical protein